MHRGEKYLLLLIELTHKHRKYVNFILNIMVVVYAVNIFRINLEGNKTLQKALLDSLFMMAIMFGWTPITSWIRRVFSKEGQINQTDFNLLSRVFSLVLSEISIEESTGDAIEYSQGKKYPLFEAYAYLMPLLAIKTLHPVIEKILLLSQLVVKLVSK